MRAPKPPTVPPTAPPIVAASETLLSPVFVGGAGVAVVEDAGGGTRLGVVAVVIEVGGDVEVGIDDEGEVDGVGMGIGVVEDTTGAGGLSVITTVVTAAVGTGELLNAAI